MPAVFRPEESRACGSCSTRMERPVELVVALGPEETPLPGAGDFDFSAETVRIVEAICALSERAVVPRRGGARRGVDCSRRCWSSPQGEDVGLRYYGTP